MLAVVPSWALNVLVARLIVLFVLISLFIVPGLLNFFRMEPF